MSKYLSDHIIAGEGADGAKDPPKKKAKKASGANMPFLSADLMKGFYLLFCFFSFLFFSFLFFSFLFFSFLFFSFLFFCFLFFFFLFFVYFYLLIIFLPQFAEWKEGIISQS